MAKRIRRNYPIYIAPKILGYFEENLPRAFDEKEAKELNPNNIDDKIYIYERQVKGWFLNRASKLVRGQNNGFIVLMICLSYLEGIQQYIEGRSSNGNSNNFFINSVHRIYPSEFQDYDLRELYSEARCGLFHNGMVSGKIIISREYTEAIEISNHDTIKINHELLLRDIRNDFNMYINNLRVDEDLRNNFDRMFSNVY